MPRKRVTGKARIEYGLFHISQLRTYHDFFDNAFGNPRDPEVIRAMKAAWPILREQVMEADRQHHGARSFHRPWGWWKFDQKIDERLDVNEQKKYLLEHPSLLTAEEKSALG